MCFYSLLVTTEQPVLPEVQPAKEFSPGEPKLQQTITVETETWTQSKAVEPLPAVRKVEDDWYILLDVATKKSGRNESVYFTYSYSLMYSCFIMHHLF